MIFDNTKTDETLNSLLSDCIEYQNSGSEIFDAVYQGFKLKEAYPQASELLAGYKKCSNIYNKSFENFSEDDLEQLIKIYEASDEFDSTLTGADLNVEAYEYFENNYKKPLDDLFDTVLESETDLKVCRGDQRFSILDSDELKLSSATNEGLDDLLARAKELECVKNYQKEVNIDGEWEKISLGDITYDEETAKWMLNGEEASIGDLCRMLTATGDEIKNGNTANKEIFEELQEQINKIITDTESEFTNDRYMSTATVRNFAERWTSKGGETGGLLAEIDVPQGSKITAIEAYLNHDGINGWGHEFEFLCAKNSRLKINRLTYNMETGLCEILYKLIEQ